MSCLSVHSNRKGSGRSGVPGRREDVFLRHSLHTPEGCGLRMSFPHLLHGPSISICYRLPVRVDARTSFPFWTLSPFKINSHFESEIAVFRVKISNAFNRILPQNK